MPQSNRYFHYFLFTVLLIWTYQPLTAQTEKAFFMKIGKGYILTNEKAELLFPDAFDAVYETTAYDDLDTSFHDEIIEYNPYQELIVKRNGKFGVFMKMAYTIPCEYDYLDRLGYVQQVKYYAKKNGSCAFLTGDGKPVTPFVYETIEQIQKSGMFRVKQDGKFKLMYQDSPLTVADYTALSYDSILVEMNYFILMQSGTKSLCVFQSSHEKDDYKCLPPAKCDYFAGESDILQVFPGKSMVSSYDFDLTFVEKRVPELNEVEENYLPFTDELNTDLGEESAELLLGFLKAIADSAGIDVTAPKTYTPEEIRKEIRFRIKNQLEQRNVSYSELGYMHNHIMSDTVSGTKHGCIIITKDPKTKTKLRTVIPPAYDEIFIESGEINHFIKYRLGSGYGILNSEGQAIFDKEWTRIELPNPHGPLIVVYSDNKAFVYKYDQLLKTKELVYTGNSELRFVMRPYRPNPVYIYRNNDETKPPIGFLNDFDEISYSDNHRKTERKSVLLAPVYDSVVDHPTLRNYFLLYQKGKVGFINNETEIVLPVVYDSIVFKYTFPLKFNTEEYDYMSKTSSFDPVILAYKNDSLYYLRRDCEESYNEPNCGFNQTASFDVCKNKITVSLNGLYFKVKLASGEYQIFNINGKLLSQDLYSYVADYAFKSHSEFWYIPAEDMQHRPVMIGKNGKIFRLPG